MSETPWAAWTPTGHLRWNHENTGPPVLQQLMTREGYTPAWAAIPGYRPTIGLAVETTRERAEAIAKRIVRHLWSRAGDTALGEPSRIAFKYETGSGGVEREGGGLCADALTREIVRAVLAAE